MERPLRRPHCLVLKPPDKLALEWVRWGGSCDLRSGVIGEVQGQEGGSSRAWRGEELVPTVLVQEGTALSAQQ